MTRAKTTPMRSALSEEFDAAMARLGISNGSVAKRCGVTEKVVREWRGRSGLYLRPLPGDMLVHFSDDLFREVMDAMRGLRAFERQAAREEALRKAVSK